MLDGYDESGGVPYNIKSKLLSLNIKSIITSRPSGLEGIFEKIDMCFENIGFSKSNKLLYI